MHRMTQLLSATCLGLAFAAPAAADGSMTVAWYGGNWGDAFQTCIAEPFTAATGTTVNVEIGTSTTTLAKLQQQAGAPTIDVAFLDGGISELAQAAGVLAPIDLSAIDNAANLEDGAAYRDGADVFAVSAGYYSVGIAYNTQEIPEAPTSWDVLWDEAYAGAVTIPSPANSAGVPMLLFFNDVLNGGADDITPTLAKLRELDVAMYFDSSGAASNAFQSGEVVLGAHFNVGAWGLADSGLPVGFAVPKEGVWATDARLHVVKGAPNPEAATAFIDQATSTASAACLAEKLHLGPAVKGVELTPDVARKLPWGEGGSRDSLRLSDWSKVNAARAELTDRWNREVAR